MFYINLMYHPLCIIKHVCVYYITCSIDNYWRILRKCFNSDSRKSKLSKIDRKYVCVCVYTKRQYIKRPRTKKRVVRPRTAHSPSAFLPLAAAAVSGAFPPAKSSHSRPAGPGSLSSARGLLRFLIILEPPAAARTLFFHNLCWLRLRRRLLCVIYLYG